MRIPAIAMLILVGASSAHSTQTPDWTSDQFLIGNWSCDRTGKNPGHEEATYAWTLNHRWLGLAYTFTPSSPAGAAITTNSFETFDTSISKWIYVSLASDGDHSTSYSDGWKNNLKTYGPSPTGIGAWRLVATKIAQREFTEEIQLSENKGWTQVALLRCRKSP